MPVVSVEFRDNGDQHEDVFVRVGDRTFVCDSYWFAVDSPGFETDDQAAYAACVRSVLHRVLDRWADVVASASDGDTVFLPFDLSDQCSRWLRCDIRGPNVSLGVVDSAMEARRIPVDDWSGLASALSVLQPDTWEPITTTREELVTDIRSCQAAMNH